MVNETTLGWGSRVTLAPGETVSQCRALQEALRFSGTPLLLNVPPRPLLPTHLPVVSTQLLLNIDLLFVLTLQILLSMLA